MTNRWCWHRVSKVEMQCYDATKPESLLLSVCSHSRLNNLNSGFLVYPKLWDSAWCQPAVTLAAPLAISAKQRPQRQPCQRSAILSRCSLLSCTLKQWQIEIAPGVQKNLSLQRGQCTASCLQGTLCSIIDPPSVLYSPQRGHSDWPIPPPLPANNSKLVRRPYHPSLKNRCIMAAWPREAIDAAVGLFNLLKKAWRHWHCSIHRKPKPCSLRSAKTPSHSGSLRCDHQLGARIG